MSDIDCSRILNLSHVFHAPIIAVFKAWTDPRILKQWWGPAGSHVYKCEVDLRVGGHWRYGINTDNIQREVFGEYLVVETAEKLVFTWQWEGGEALTKQTTVTVLFTEQNDHSTLVTIQQQEFQNKASRDQHGVGWESSINSLDDYLTVSTATNLVAR